MPFFNMVILEHYWLQQAAVTVTLSDKLLCTSEFYFLLLDFISSKSYEYSKYEILLIKLYCMKNV